MIRELAPADLELGRDLHEQLHRHHDDLPLPPGFRARPFLASWVAWRGSVATAIGAGTAVVFVHVPDDEERPDGLAYLRALKPETVGRPFLEPTGPHVELSTLVVAESARNTGVGSALADAGNGWARDRGAVALHIGVRATNVDAHRLYVRRGAQPTFELLVQPL